MTSLTLRGVRVNNLRGIDIDIPIGKITVVTGVSGAGKSSLVFDTLYAESQRRYLQGFSPAARALFERTDRPDAEQIGDLPPAVALRALSETTIADRTVAGLAEVSTPLARWFAAGATATCPSCERDVRPRDPADVADALAHAPAGTRVTIAFADAPAEGENAAAWRARLLEEGYVRARVGDRLVRLADEALPEGETLVVVDRLEVGKSPTARFREAAQLAAARGGGRWATFDEQVVRHDARWRCPACDVTVPEPTPRRFEPGDGQFAPEARMFRRGERTIAAWHAQPLGETHRLLASDPSAARVVETLARLVDLGLGRLPLAAETARLATGELQRLRWARATASPLVDAAYLLEEPTAGLNADDVRRFLPRVRALCELGNTVVVVDHHPAWLAIADHWIDLGPGAGEEGGQVVYQGPVAGLASCDASLTSDAFYRDEPSPVRRKPSGTLLMRGLGPILGARESLALPLGVLAVVTGRSGAGKTRVLRDAFAPALGKLRGRDLGPAIGELVGPVAIDDVAYLDRSAPAKSARAAVATHLKIFDEVRDLFAQTAEAKIRNFDAGAFSFHQAGGRCETCEGQGFREVDMQFLPDVRAVCPECLGRRYRREILDVKVRSLSIAETLDLTVREAFRFFRAQRSLEKKLKGLLDVGLGYVRLGQSLRTLSGGEAQRLKLAGLLTSTRKARTLFLLAEPTAGLHPADWATLRECFGHLIAAGHSVVIADASPEALRHADAVVEL